MADQNEIYVVRHGETEWSLSGQHTSITDIPLTENGKKVARLFKPLFAKENLLLILSSPLIRAKETCELAGLGQRVDLDPDLMEWNYGDYEGLTSEQIHEKKPDWMLFRDGCPGGESPEQVGRRVDRVIAKVRAIDGKVALFAHGHILRVFVARWLRLPVVEGSRFMLDTATLSILSYYQGDLAVKRWNAPI